MKPKTKILALAFSLILPYLALAMYFSFRIQEHPLPTWFPYFGLSYILGTVVVVMVFSRKIHRDGQPTTVQRPVSALGWIGRVWVGYLVAVWAGLFLWGTYQTILGNLEWQRAVPAGAFLLAFIVLFSWSLYKDIKRQTRRMASTGAKTTDKA